MASRNTIGRGGAGNALTGPKEPVNTDELATPTIKQQTYTTGRGGSGNMASNDDPESARKAQDVEGKVDDREKKGTFHWGRGGEGNMTTIGEDKDGDKDKDKDKKDQRPKLEGRKSTNRGSSSSQRRPSWVEKGKEKLGLKGQKAAEGSAIED